MKTIKVQELSNEKFARYGEYQNLLDDKELAKKSIFPGGFFADVMKLDLGSTTLPTVSVCQAMKPEKMEVKMLEAHQFTCEGLLPLDGDVAIFVGAPAPGQKFNVDQLEAFLVPKGTFVRLNPYIIHGAQFAIHEEEAHVLCLLPGRTFRNDMEAVMLTEEERAVLVME